MQLEHMFMFIAKTIQFFFVIFNKAGAYEPELSFEFLPGMM
jgi:hypothetical protein